VFPNNLSSSTTAGRRVLIATQGFALLGIVTPDFVVPNGFLPTDGGTLNYAGFDSVTLPPLPTDGTTAIKINRNPITAQMIPALATNFAGLSAPVTAVGPPAAIVPVAGVVESERIRFGVRTGLPERHAARRGLLVPAGRSLPVVSRHGAGDQQRVHRNARQVRRRPVRVMRLQW
jgi:hypothetical protein